MNAPDSHDAIGIDVRWTDGASTNGARPTFLRGMVRRLAEKKARELGYAEITEEILDQFKRQMMGRMGGEAGMAAAAEDMAKGVFPGLPPRKDGWIPFRNSCGT